jgi:hypothetical protein
MNNHKWNAPKSKSMMQQHDLAECSNLQIFRILGIYVLQISIKNLQKLSKINLPAKFSGQSGRTAEILDQQITTSRFTYHLQSFPTSVQVKDQEGKCTIVSTVFDLVFLFPSLFICWIQLWTILSDQ